ncbi:unnamed protein product, partial [Rangifer tarandus platyrhynchus]
KGSCPLRVHSCVMSLGRGHEDHRPGGPAVSGLGGELGRATALSPVARACPLIPPPVPLEGPQSHPQLRSLVSTTCTSDPIRKQRQPLGLALPGAKAPTHSRGKAIRAAVSS